MKRSSQNMQQIYRRTPMSKCDFKKVAKQLLYFDTFEDTSGKCPYHWVYHLIKKVFR